MRAVTVIGAGFAGSEAAWAIAQRGVPARLVEMRPAKMTPAHQTGYCAELVCSNSFKSLSPTSPAGRLKIEMEQLGSLTVPIAKEHAVPAGEALAVDRELFAKAVSEAIARHPNIERIEEETTEVPSDGPTIIATGPLTSDALAQSISQITGQERLHFFDAVSPIVDAASIDYDKVFTSSRYDKGDPGYLNCPMDKEQYEAFVAAIREAERTPLHSFEDTRFFEGCVPLEELADRGLKTLSFGPMKPVGLTDPRTGRRPYAVLQLRPENAQKTMYSLVACQTRLKWGEQKRIFQMAPGLENAEFVRLGVIHRNTYLDSPRLLDATLQLRTRKDLFFAGQLTGVEGYLESAASGIIAGINAARLALGQEPVAPPPETVLGSLLCYISSYDHQPFPPMNASWGLLPHPEPMIKDKGARRAKQLESAISAMDEFARNLNERSKNGHS
ncbi:MAG: methylenetetrahydrofolate--tRNA-(uracil(54)-C(5))-methyltransferase (FADH(2)-oxidizing) TrmFO [Armatimonadetes bacterium]|nr:methylenetetrahydrofolate--tRNA-(uracil(54)-C(5))-methyltransferase (FADH(2)-oxidizing) TrmFO [Armatimonadota bacterium]